MKAILKFNRNNLLFLFVFIICIIFSNNVSAESYYAGTSKSGNNKGIAAKIKTPAQLPQLGYSGESCWVTNVYGSPMEWVQTGLRYYNGYGKFKTYVESNISGVYNLTEIGVHVLDFAGHYRVSYNSDGKWHAYIGYTDKGSFMMNSTAGVQAEGESHAIDTQLGPFDFIQVVYANSDGEWNWMDETPTATYPFNVTIIDNANYTVY